MTDYLTVLAKLGENATEGPWEAYFTVHGDPYVVPGEGFKGRELMHQIAQVSTAPDDYGRANNLFIAVSRNVWDEMVAVVRASARVAEALVIHRQDMHQSSNRPCSTCNKSAQALREYDRRIAALKAKVTSLPNPAPSTEEA